MSYISEGLPVWSKISQDDYIDFLVNTANQQNIVCYFCGSEDFVVLNDAEHCAIFAETTLQSPLYFLGIRCRTCGTLYKHSLDVVIAWLADRNGEGNNGR